MMRRVDASECAKYLKNADNYLILTHKKPDGDTVGSAAALCRGLRQMGKTAYVLKNPDITPRYEGFVKPLYPNADFKPDTIIAVDVADKTLLPNNVPLGDDETVALSIDHHDSSRAFAKVLYNESDSAATGELVALILCELGVKLDSDMATALYAAISTDTGCFQFANTTPRTHRIVGELMESGADWYELNQTLFSIKTPTRLAAEGAILRGLRFYLDGRISVAVISKALCAETGATQDDLDGISSLAYQIEGVEAGVTVFEQSDGYKISMRTGSRVDAGKVCAKFGGGGHNRAAGCHFAENLDVAIDTLVCELTKELTK